MDQDPLTVENGSYCYRLSDNQDRAIFATKLAFLAVSILTNIAAVGVLIYFKSYRRFVFRLVLSLLLASLLGVVVQILEVMPLDHTDAPTLRPGWKATCSAFGFLDQVTMWMSNFVIIWIVGYLCWLMIQPGHKVNMFTSKVTVVEAVGISVCFFLPFTFNWIPFTSDYYGPSGHWCWIRLTRTANCTDTNIRDGAIYIFLLYYGPLVVIMSVTTVIAIIALITWCKNLVRSDTSKDMAFIAVYPILFNVAGCIVTANRIEEFRRISSLLPPNFGLWMAHAVADPIRTLLPAAFFLLQFLIPTARDLVIRSREVPQEEGRYLNRAGESTVYASDETRPLMEEKDTPLA